MKFADKKVIAGLVLLVLYTIAIWKLYQKYNALPSPEQRTETEAGKLLQGRAGSRKAHGLKRQRLQELPSALTEAKSGKGDSCIDDASSAPDDAVHLVAMPINKSGESGTPPEPPARTDSQAALGNSHEGGMPAQDFVNCGEYEEYVVRTGDTLWSIVEKMYNIMEPQEIKRTIQKVIEANPWLKTNPDRMSVGKVLLLPVPRKKSALEVLPIEHKLPIRRNDPTKHPLVAGFTDSKEKPTCTQIHEVNPGETLYSLAQKYYHDRTKWLWIYQANLHINPNSLACGTRLQIPLYRGDK
jgi:LysM repeat protein